MNQYDASDSEVELVKCAVCDQIIAGGKWFARIQHEPMNIMVALCCPLCTQAFESNPHAYVRRIAKLPDDDRWNPHSTTNFNERRRDAALRWVNALRKIGPCDITVEYVSWPPQESCRLGLGDHMWLEETPPEIQQLLERDLKEKVRDLLGEENMKIRVEAGWGRLDPQLIESASAEKADLIVVGTHQRHGVGRFWLGSVSRGISICCYDPPTFGASSASCSHWAGIRATSQA